MSHATALFALIALALFAPLSAHAQEPPPKPTPTQVQVTGSVTSDSMQSQMDAMMPMMGQVMVVMMNAMLEVAARPETAAKMATFSKNFFDALIAKGFTRDEALRIVMATGLPSMPGQR